MNAYVQALVTEWKWTMLGPKFSKDTRKSAVVVSTLDGLKSAGAAFRSYLASCMESMGYLPCRICPDLWMRLKICPEDKVQYYV